MIKVGQCGYFLTDVLLWKKKSLSWEFAILNNVVLMITVIVPAKIREHCVCTHYIHI